jgi:uridine kinase
MNYHKQSRNYFKDSYYKENHGLSFDERALINFDHPRAIDFELLVKHLKELKKATTSTSPFIPL